jgi:tetratricopeptide (TPR) repeat protein
MDPEHPFALMNVALAYEALGEKEKSVNYSNKAVKLNPEDPWVLHETRRIQKSRDH